MHDVDVSNLPCIVHSAEDKSICILDDPHISFILAFKGDGNPDDYYVLYERS